MTISVWSMFWGWGLAWRASWALPSDLEIKAPWLHSHGPRRSGGVGGRRRRGLGSKLSTWVSFPWPREAGLASLIVCWLKAPSLVVVWATKEWMPTSFVGKI